MRSGRQGAVWWIALVAGLLTVLAYLPSFGGPLVFDDAAHIPPLWSLVKDGSIFGLWEAIWSSGAGPTRRPVSMLTFALQVQWFGPRPLPLELGNLAIHMATGATLFLIARTLLRTAPSLRVSEGHAAAVAGVIVLLWLVHPLNLTSVAYLIQRMNGLAALFTALAVLSWLRMRTAEPSARRPIRSLMWVIVLGVAGFLSKENAILLPVFILVIETTLYDDLTVAFHRRVPSPRWRLALLVGATALAVAFLIWRTSGGYGNRPFDLEERLLTETGVLLWYLKSLFLPDLNELSLLHDNWPVWSSLAEPAPVLSMAAVLGLLGVALWACSRLPLLAFGIFWFLAGHLLESGFLALDLVYEYRNYLPGFGVLFAVVALMERGSVAFPVWRKAGLAAAALVITVFTVQTHQRAERWGNNDQARLAHLLSLSGSMQASIMSAGLLATMAGRAEEPEKRERLLARAQEQFGHALEVAPDGSPAPLFGWIQMRGRHGMGPMPELWEDARHRLTEGRIDDATVNGIHSLTRCVTTGPCQDPDGKLRGLLHVLLERSDIRDKTRSRALRDLARYTVQIDEDRQRTLQLLRRAAELVPTDLDVRMELAYHLATGGEDRAALAELERVRRADSLGRKAYTRRQLEFAIRTGRI